MTDHWKNDFLITSQGIEAYHNYLIFQSDGVYCYSGMDHIKVTGKASVLILGRVFDIENITWSVTDIATCIQDHYLQGNVEAYLQNLSGRFLILIQDDQKSIIYPDACAMLSIYYGEINGIQVAGSSPKLINQSLQIQENINPEIWNFLDSEAFRKNGCYWIGDTSIDNKYKLLLANHYLRLHDQKMARRTLQWKDADLPYSRKVSLFAHWVVKSLEALKDKDMMIPVTAGIDSRIIYAASKNVSLKAQYYLFDTASNATDIAIGSQICHIGGDHLNIYQEEAPPLSFREDFASLFYYITEDDRISHFYHHALHDKNKLNVNGNGGDIIRGYYQYYDTSNAKTILDYTGYKDFSFLRASLQKWLATITVNNQLSISDYLYWEQKTSNWFGRYQYEKNFYINDFSPYNNYKLILLGFSLPYPKRRAYVNRFQKDVVAELFPAINHLSINPEQTFLHQLKLRAYQNAFLWWMIKKLAHKFRS